MVAGGCLAHFLASSVLSVPLLPGCGNSSGRYTYLGLVALVFCQAAYTGFGAVTGRWFCQNVECLVLWQGNLIVIVEIFY